MPNIPVHELGTVGVISDYPPQDMPLNGFTDSLNMHFRHGRIEKMLGRVDTGIVFDDDPGGSPTLNYDPRWFQTWLYNGDPYVAFGTTSRILYSSDFLTVAVASLFREDTITVATPTPTEWQSDVYGDYAIMNPLEDAEGPFYSSTRDGSVFTVLPGWGNAAASGGGGASAPTGAAKFVRSFKNFLVAVQDSDPYTLNWSNGGQPNAFPPDWTWDDPGSLAGRKAFGANDGCIVDAVPLGDTIIVYTEFAAYAAVLTNDLRVFGFRRLFSWGLVNWECAAQFENFHFCIGNGAIYIHDGSRVRRVADNRVEERFFEELQSYERVHVTKHAEEHEIIIYYSKTSAVGMDQAFIYNWLEGDGGLFYPESMDIDTYCIKPSVLPPTDIEWDSYSGDWDDQTVSWNELRSEDNRRRMFQLYAADLSGAFPAGQTKAQWLRRDATEQRDGSEFLAYVERRHMDFDEVLKTMATIKLVSRAYLQLTGAGLVYVQFGVAFSLTEDPAWGPVQTFDMDSDDYKIDLREEGRYISYRIGIWPGAGTIVPSRPVLTGMDLEMELEEGLR